MFINPFEVLHVRICLLLLYFGLAFCYNYICYGHKSFQELSMTERWLSVLWILPVIWNLLLFIIDMILTLLKTFRLLFMKR